MLTDENAIYSTLYTRVDSLGICKRPTYRFEDSIDWERWYFWRSGINIYYRLIQCIRGFCSSPLPIFKLSLQVPWIDSSNMRCRKRCNFVIDRVYNKVIDRRVRDQMDKWVWIESKREVLHLELHMYNCGRVLDTAPGQPVYGIDWIVIKFDWENGSYLSDKRKRGRLSPSLVYTDRFYRLKLTWWHHFTNCNSHSQLSRPPITKDYHIIPAVMVQTSPINATAYLKLWVLVTCSEYIRVHFIMYKIGANELCSSTFSLIILIEYFVTGCKYNGEMHASGDQWESPSHPCQVFQCQVRTGRYSTL